MNSIGLLSCTNMVSAATQGTHFALELLWGDLQLSQLMKLGQRPLSLVELLKDSARCDLSSIASFCLWYCIQLCASVDLPRSVKGTSKSALSGVTCFTTVMKK